MFLAPLVDIVPFEAATPALVVVGFLMMTQISQDRLGGLRDRHPGVPDDRPDAVHVLDHRGHRRRLHRYVLIKLALGKAAEVHPLMWGAAALFVVYFAIGPIKATLGVI